MSDKWTEDHLLAESAEVPADSAARATFILAAVVLQVGEDLTEQLRKLNANIEHGVLRATVAR